MPLLLLRPAPRAGRPTAQPSCVPRSCPALAGKWAAGESRRAQAAGHGHRALGGGGRGSGLDAPRALRRWLLRRRDGCAFVPAASCSFSPDSCCLCAAPSTWTWTVPPSTPAPREVTLASRWISSCPARLRKWPHFEGGVGPLPHRAHPPCVQTPEGETSGRDPAVCLSAPTPRRPTGCFRFGLDEILER